MSLKECHEQAKHKLNPMQLRLWEKKTRFESNEFVPPKKILSRIASLARRQSHVALGNYCHSLGKDDSLLVKDWSSPWKGGSSPHGTCGIP